MRIALDTGGRQGISIASATTLWLCDRIGPGILAMTCDMSHANSQHGQFILDQNLLNPNH